MTATNQVWLNQTFAYAKDRREGYYEESVNLLSMLVMSGNAWLLATNPCPKLSRDGPVGKDILRPMENRIAAMPQHIPIQ